MGTFSKKQEQNQQPSQEEIQQRISQEIAQLQDTGIYRIRKLGQQERLVTAIEKLNESIETICKDFGTEILALKGSKSSEEVNEDLIEAGEREMPKEDDEDDSFDLPPLPPKKK